ncbi:MAG TPA: hypothetical protein VKS22_13100 [Candidatus Binataceae bacterium]|nr:hypothetical protein [Candidatus Binataceae bacterium]
MTASSKARLLRLLIASLAFALIAGCTTHRETSAPPDQPAAADDTVASAPAAPEAKIHISYAHPGDFLDSLSVTKYSSAQTLDVPVHDSGATLVRFDTGVVVWEFAVAKDLLSGVPMVGSGPKKYTPAEIKYGDLPAHFIASIPDSGPPEPLEPDHYYVFAVTRGSGAVSYEAVKVNGDGSLEAYEADPRAGSSFRLCCNVAADFTLTAPADAPPADSAP